MSRELNWESFKQYHGIRFAFSWGIFTIILNSCYRSTSVYCWLNSLTLIKRNCWMWWTRQGTTTPSTFERIWSLWRGKPDNFCLIKSWNTSFLRICLWIYSWAVTASWENPLLLPGFRLIFAIQIKLLKSLNKSLRKKSLSSLVQLYAELFVLSLSKRKTVFITLTNFWQRIKEAKRCFCKVHCHWPRYCSSMMICCFCPLCLFVQRTNHLSICHHCQSFTKQELLCKNVTFMLFNGLNY